MQDFSHKKDFEVDAVLFRRLIAITSVTGSLLALLSYLGCAAKIACLSPSRVVFGVIYIVIALYIYGEFAASLLLGKRSAAKLLLAVAGKGIWALGLLWMLWHASRLEQVAIILGLLSFIPGTIGALLVRRG